MMIEQQNRPLVSTRETAVPMTYTVRDTLRSGMCYRESVCLTSE